MKSSKACLALTTAAMSLPGITPDTAQAQTVPETIKIGYRYTNYQEADLPKSASGGNVDLPRYDIDIHQFSLVAPVTSTMSLSASGITETLSGASPWFIVENSDGQLVQVMSGATIVENRDEINGSISFYGDASQKNVGLSYSTENDYDSLGLTLSGTVWLNENNTTVDAGLSIASDTITPTDKGSGGITEESKDRITVFGGFSQVLTKTTLIGANFSFSNYEGYLSDPYKLVFVNGTATPDSRPRQRRQWSLDTKLRNYQNLFASALHLDYRLYVDDWGVSSHTVSPALYTNFFESWQTSVTFRYYAQTAADFYGGVFKETREDGFYSNDYRLSEYESTSWKFGLKKRIAMVDVYAAYELYDSFNGSNPGLVDFNLFTVGLDLNF